MADKKISALTSATLPLAGTEVFPLVQSSATVKTPVSSVLNQSGTEANVKALTATGALASLTASSVAADVFGGGARIFGIGANTSTAGTLKLITSSTNASVYYENIVLNANGTSTFGDNLIQGTAAKGVNFTANTPAAGMTSQLLNWYEEGTWTGTLTGGTTAPTTAVTATGNYTRVGNVVTISIIFANKDTTGASGQMLVTGLPFTAKTGVNQIGSVTSNGLSIPNKTLNTWISGGTTTIEFVSAADNGAWAFPDITAGAGKSLYITLSYHV